MASVKCVVCIAGNLNIYTGHTGDLFDNQIYYSFVFKCHLPGRRAAMDDVVDEIIFPVASIPSYHPPDEKSINCVCGQEYFNLSKCGRVFVAVAVVQLGERCERIAFCPVAHWKARCCQN